MFLRMQNKENPRALSHDERYAAEAAFAGRPLNPRWSARAKAVYEGIQKSLPTQEISDSIVDSALSEEPLASMPVPTEPRAESAQPSDRSTQAPIPFQQAIDTGALIDVTPTAKQLGLSFSVTVTKPLWDTGIAPTNTLTE
jgi:hypothetical protein